MTQKPQINLLKQLKISNWTAVGRVQKGFALIATLSMMVLLTTIAVGLLTLSAVSIRESSQGSAKRVAMSNARLALLIALGDLQRHAGPDKRITAPSSVLSDNVVQSHLTGVWTSRAFDPAAMGADGAAAKVDNFHTWLVSGDPSKTSSLQYAENSPSDIEPLLTQQVLGDVTGETSAGRVWIGDSLSTKPKGSYAYAVFDEGVKARVNLGQAKPRADLASRAGALSSGQRPGIDRVEGTGTIAADGFSLDDSMGLSRIGKLVSLTNADLAYNAGSGSFNQHFHDLTTDSLGLICNVSTGGFKKDLSLIAESVSLPAEFAGKSVYESAYNLDIPSDPTWTQLISSLNLYRGMNSGGSFLSSDGGVPVLRATAPSDWNAGNGVQGGSATPNLQSPSGPVLMPAIAKVQMIFSLASRDIYRYPRGQAIPENAGYVHNPWGGFFRNPMNEGKEIDSKYDYLLHMIYTPVVTLHNPYNVAIEFKDLRVEFVDLPFSLQVFRNGVAQSKGLVPFSGMYGGGGAFGQSKRFGLNLGGKNASGVPDGSSVRLAPGEAKVFSPYIPPSRNWDQEIGNPLWFVDWANNNSVDGRTWTNLDVDTSKIKAVSGWRGDGIGFDIDSFAPGKYNVSNVEIENGHRYQRDQCIGLREEDGIHVEFAPIPDPDRNTTRFTVEMTLVGANPDTNARTSVIEFQYQALKGLQTELLGTDARIRYPESGEIKTMEMFDHSSVPMGSTSNTRPFALFSAFAKTTHGGFNGSDADGAYATKPWSFHNNSALTASQDIVGEHPAHHSLEIDLVRLPGNTDEIMNLEPGTDRGHFISGHRSLTGRHLGTIHDIQLGPAMNMMTLNSAGPASSYYLPRFTAPIGNSFAHPLLSSDSVLESGAAGYLYADHSFLLNSILFDGYYFSGIQGRQGSFGDGKNARDIAAAFLDGYEYLPDIRFQPHLADGVSTATATDKILGNDGYQSAGAYQLLKGAFNVNSTSVDAWMAVLSAMTGKGGSILTVPAGLGAASLEALNPPLDSKGARFSRFSLPNAQPDSTSAEGFWQAPRDLNHDQLKLLATEIVAQVRIRGPFLSMSDFVNRQPGPNGSESLSGPLQAAIDKSGLNNNSDLGGFEITEADVADQELAYTDAATGSSAQGAPGFLTQADLLGVLGNAATVRSDTFVIRGYGDARDSTNKVTARAWCEAVVQRMPEYVDPLDPADTAPADLQSSTNKIFGRRFEMVSFRWLSPQEI